MKEVKNTISGFMDFVREAGVIGLAVAFMLGGAITKVVTSLVNDMINPILGIFLGAAGNLKEMAIMVGGAKIAWGSFVNSIIDFVIVAAVVYFGVKKLGLDKLDKKKA